MKVFKLEVDGEIIASSTSRSVIKTIMFTKAYSGDHVTEPKSIRILENEI